MHLFGIDFFRVELYRQHETAAGDLHQFRDPIFRAATDHYSLAWLFDRLVMKAIHQERTRTQYLLHATASQHINTMRQVITRHFPPAVPQAIWAKVIDILIERAT